MNKFSSKDAVFHALRASCHVPNLGRFEFSTRFGVVDVFVSSLCLVEVDIERKIVHLSHEKNPGWLGYIGD